METAWVLSVDPTTDTDRIWLEVRSLCESHSNVDGNGSDFGVVGQVWAANTGKAKLDSLRDVLVARYPHIEESVFIDRVIRDETGAWQPDWEVYPG